MATPQKPIDSKREEFRKYLERSGVMEAMTRCLVSLYEEPERPEEPLEYVKDNLIGTEHLLLDALRFDLEEAYKKIDGLTKQLAELKAKYKEEDEEENKENGESN